MQVSDNLIIMNHDAFIISQKTACSCRNISTKYQYFEFANNASLVHCFEAKFDIESLPNHCIWYQYRIRVGFIIRPYATELSILLQIDIFSMPAMISLASCH